jgi:hypothetical protein
VIFVPSFTRPELQSKAFLRTVGFTRNSANQTPIKDDPRKPDSELLTLRVQAHAGFSICGDMKVPEGGIKSEHFKMV